jgi:CheY-like chemotaxis protein
MLKSAHILLAEDNRMDVELTLDAFRERNLTNSIHVAANGQLALDYLFGRGEYADRIRFPLPDLVLLDLKMPIINGIEVLRQIKTSETLKRIPVIMLTSSKEEGDLAMSYDNGVNSYLTKPVSFDGFLEVVHKVHDYWLTLNVPPPLRLGPEPESLDAH